MRNKKRIKKLEEEVQQMYQWAEWHEQKFHNFPRKKKGKK